jgi:hypothetical protein
MPGAFFRSCYYLIKMDFLRSIPARHAELKKRIHAFKMPLSPAGIQVMQVVYITIPIVAGYFVMEWANGQADKNLGKNGELLKKDIRLNSHAKTTAQQKEGLQRLLDSHKPDVNPVTNKE